MCVMQAHSIPDIHHIGGANMHVRIFSVQTVATLTCVAHGVIGYLLPSSLHHVTILIHIFPITVMFIYIHFTLLFAICIKNNTSSSITIVTCVLAVVDIVVVVVALVV